MGVRRERVPAVCESTDAAVVIDPGADSPRLAAAIAAEQIDVQAVLLTHSHIDHVEGLPDIRSVVPEAPIWLHPEALGMYQAVPHQAARFGLQLDDLPDPTDEFVPGRAFNFGDCSFEVRFTPGHAPGHVTLVEPARAWPSWVTSCSAVQSAGRTSRG